MQDLPAAEVDMGGGVMIEEEDMIVDIPREADIVVDIEVDLGDILHIESFKRRLGGYGHYRITDERKDSKDPQSCRCRRRYLYYLAGMRYRD